MLFGMFTVWLLLKTTKIKECLDWLRCTGCAGIVLAQHTQRDMHGKSYYLLAYERVAKYLTGANSEQAPL